MSNSRLANFWSQVSTGDRIPLETAKIMIVSALSQFDQELGHRAKAILDDDARMNIIENPENPTGRQAVRPAGITEDDLKEMGMFTPDFKEKYGRYFHTQINEEGEAAIIDFEYNGTAQDVVYLAHELGHAIADDVQRLSGKNFRNFSLDELEQQAYFVQNIFSRYTKQSSPESLAASGQQNEISDNRVQQFKTAATALEKGLETKIDQRRAFAILALGGDPAQVSVPTSVSNSAPSALIATV